jgi:hypothetical protein
MQLKCFYETVVQGLTPETHLNFRGKNPAHRQARTVIPFWVRHPNLDFILINPMRLNESIAVGRATLLSLRANYQILNLLLAIAINLVIVFLVLRFIHAIERRLGEGGINILRKIFGIILLAIAIKMFTQNIGTLLKPMG